MFSFSFFFSSGFCFDFVFFDELPLSIFVFCFVLGICVAFFVVAVTVVVCFVSFCFVHLTFVDAFCFVSFCYSYSFAFFWCVLLLPRLTIVKFDKCSFTDVLCTHNRVPLINSLT